MNTKRILSIIIAATLCFSLCSCKNKGKYESYDFFAMDTIISVVAESPNIDSFDVVETTVDQIENIFSKTQSSSDIGILNSTLSSEVSSICAEVMLESLKVSQNTVGAFNPCMGLVVNLWDIMGNKYIPEQEEINNLLPYCKHDSYTVNGNIISKDYAETQIDLGAAVKGYTAELVINKLKASGVSDAMISIGGNIAVTGSAPGRNGFWRVAVKNPFYTEQIAGYIDCTDKVISVSGDYERYFEKDGKIYHHIFDPETGYPVSNGIKSVAVIADDGLISDALSTALFVMGKDKALEFYEKEFYDFEAVIFTDDGKVHLTKGIENKFVLSENSCFAENSMLSK